MTQEYQPVVRERPEHLETKSTVDTVLGYRVADEPFSSRSGEAVTDDERQDADIVPGTFAAGNGVQNSNVRRASTDYGDHDERDGGPETQSGSSGGSGGVTRQSGGKVTSTRRGSTGPGGNTASTEKSSGADAKPAEKPST